MIHKIYKTPEEIRKIYDKLYIFHKNKIETFIKRINNSIYCSLQQFLGIRIKWQIDGFYYIQKRENFGEIKNLLTYHINKNKKIIDMANYLQPEKRISKHEQLKDLENVLKYLHEFICAKSPEEAEDIINGKINNNDNDGMMKLLECSIFQKK